MLSSQLIKNNRPIKEIVVENIKRLLNDSNCVLFGAGLIGESVYSFISENIGSGDDKIRCFVDNNPLKWGTNYMGKPVLSADEVFSSYNGEAVIISCGTGDAIMAQLSKYDIPDEKIYIPDITAIREDDIEFIERNLNYFNLLYDELADEKSKEVLASILNYKLIHDTSYIQKIADKEENQYFDDELIKFTQDDVFLDCGGYIGDTIESYCRHNKGLYKQIICLEADSDNYKILQKMKNDYRVELYNIAAYNKESELCFDKRDVGFASGSGTVLEGKSPKVQHILVKGNTIDNILHSREVTFIKMDIEGAEYQALIGAADTIHNYKPTLMISVYHKQDDLIKIPLLIKSLNYKYKLYLRHYQSRSVQETVLYAINED